LSAARQQAAATQQAESRSAVAAAAVLADSLAAAAPLAWIAEDLSPAAGLAEVQTVSSSANSRHSATSSTLVQALLAGH